MEQKNNMVGIALLAFIFSLVAISGTTTATTISNAMFNLIAGENINITQVGNDITISAPNVSNVSSDPEKLNRNGSLPMTGHLNLNNNNINNVGWIHAAHYASVGEINEMNLETGFDYSTNFVTKFSYTSSTDMFSHNSDVTLENNRAFFMKSLAPNYLVCSSALSSLVSCSLSDINLSDYNNNYGFINNSTIDRLLSNYTNNYNWINNSTMAPDNLKVNKTGDNITGALGVYNISINTVANYLDLNTNYGVRLNVSDSISEIRARAVNRISFFPNIYQTNTFYEVMSNNITGNIQKDNLIYSLQSNQTTAVFSGYKSSIRFETRYDPYYIVFAPGNNSGGSGYGAEQLNLSKNNVMFPQQNGTGLAAACFDNNGNLTRSKNATSNYLTC